MDFELRLAVTAYTKEQLVTTGKPQLALAGRSNVGKSSLINAMAGGKKIAKTSSTPGKTRSINYYLIMPHDFFLVDLPGYGYARASQTERREWAGLLDEYFTQSKTLTTLVILLDCRLEPQQNDLDMIAYAQHLGLQILPVLTKADKATQRDLAKRVKTWSNLIETEPLVTSSSKKRGINQLCHKFLEVATSGERHSICDNAITTI